MRFYIRERNRPPSVIIVALIDVLVVLVIFLVVTTTFKHQPALKLALPESAHATRIHANENAPFLLYVDEKGTLRVGADAREISPAGLTAELAQAVKINPEIRLFVSADRKAPFGQIVKVMDSAKEGGVRYVSAFTKESGRP